MSPAEARARVAGAVSARDDARARLSAARARRDELVAGVRSLEADLEAAERAVEAARDELGAAESRLLGPWLFSVGNRWSGHLYVVGREFRGPRAALRLGYSRTGKSWQTWLLWIRSPDGNWGAEHEIGDVDRGLLWEEDRRRAAVLAEERVVAAGYVLTAPGVVEVAP